jgi:hypothetical protein
MKTSDIQNTYIFRTRIDLDGGEYVTLREPSVKELDEMNGSGRDVAALTKLFPACLVDHSFTNEDGG